MRKIFEIPIYALNKNKLKTRVKKAKQLLRDSMPPALSEEKRRICEELCTYPQRMWNYNHIVGYISVSVAHYDIIFDIYLPTPTIERYDWHSKVKKFVYNISANGTHFYVYDHMTTEDIRLQTTEMLDSIIKTHIPKRYFVDREAFDTINPYLDYRGILNGGIA